MSVRLLLRCTLLAIVALAATSLVVGAQGSTSGGGQTVRMAKIPIPGKPLKSFDISFVDPVAGKYFLADRSNASIDVVAIDTMQVIQQVGGFVGFTGKSDTSGPDGVLVTFSNKEVWAGDGDSTVKVIDLTANKVVASISTGGKNRADEMAYDPKDNILAVANNADDPPFATLISVGSRQVLKKIVYEGADGLEQPYWDPNTGMFFLSVVGTPANPGGAIDEIDPIGMTVINTFPLNDCNPTGLQGGPTGSHQLMAGCGNAGHLPIVDINTGKIIADFPQAGSADEVWFNPGDNRYYAASTAFQEVTVVDGLTNTFVQNVQTGLSSHSVAADEVTNEVFVPIVSPDPACPNGCLLVFANPNTANKGLTAIRPTAVQ